MLALLMALALGAAGLRTSFAQPTEQPLRVQLRWLPQAQFAGFYVAQDRDLFEAIRHPSTWRTICGRPPTPD